jgi:hypothetical protein
MGRVAGAGYSALDDATPVEVTLVVGGALPPTARERGGPLHLLECGRSNVKHRRTAVHLCCA